MAKLPAKNNFGFNAGDSYNVKFIRIDKIVIDPEIAGIFQISDVIKEKIKESILNNGFHKEEPVVLWAGKNILLDGHTRYTAAKEAGLTEIPFIEKHFESLEEAKLYALGRQALRRNLTNSEILYAAQKIPDKKAPNGYGRSVKAIAELLGVSESTIAQARKILKDGDEETIQKVKNNEMSIKAGAGYKTPSFLNGAVILLTNSNEINAANLLINHYLEDDTAKNKFIDLLPEAARKLIIVPVH